MRRCNGDFAARVNTPRMILSRPPQLSAPGGDRTTSVVLVVEVVLIRQI